MQDSKRDTDVITDFWTMWEKVRVGQYERIALKHIYYHAHFRPRDTYRQKVRGWKRYSMQMEIKRKWE